MTSDPSIWPFPSSFRRTPPVVMTHPLRSVLRLSRSWSQSVDQPQDFLEQFSRHRDLGHLEDGVAGMAHDLGTDLHEFLPQAGPRDGLAAGALGVDATALWTSALAQKMPARSGG